MGETKHTPLPWYFEDSDHVTIYPVNGTKDGITSAYGHYRGRDEKTANAEFIVKACNAHYDLVLGLEKSHEMLLKHNSDYKDSGFYFHNIAAIAKAKGDA